MVIRLRVTTGTADAARRISDRLVEDADAEATALATAVFEDAAAGQWQADAYYADMPDRSAVLELIADLLGEATAIALEAVPEENWVAISQAALPPVGAGRFSVHGSHDRQRIGVGPWAIEIDAGEAFGTAHHATTQGCLLAIDRLARGWRAKNVLDLGCGSGVLAIAAARLWPGARIAASDIDPLATGVARANMALNRAGRRIRVATATGLAHPMLRGRAPYDLIIANILAGPLVRLAPTLARATRTGGRVVLSGLLGEQVREVAGAYAMAGFRRERVVIDHNWATLVLVRAGRGGKVARRGQLRRPAFWPAAPRAIALDWAGDTALSSRGPQPQ